MAPTEYSQQFSAGFFARPCQHEYVRTVELSNLCSRDEATANWEGKKERKQTRTSLESSVEYISLFTAGRVTGKLLCGFL